MMYFSNHTVLLQLVVSPPVVSTGTFVMVIRMLAIMCGNCPDLAVVLLRQSKSFLTNLSRFEEMKKLSFYGFTLLQMSWGHLIQFLEALHSPHLKFRNAFCKDIMEYCLLQEL